MLNKLLKYDLKSVFNVLFVFYGLSLLFALLTRLFLSMDNSVIMYIIGQVCSGVTISMMFNIFINNLMRLWVRFKQNLYGDESYLTHTLPVDKKILYFSKVFTGIITLFISVLVIGLTLFIAYYSKENFEVVKNFLLPVVNVYGSTIVKILFAFLFIFFLQFLNALQSGFAGIILGHKMNNSKTGYSILFGFFSYMGIQIFGLLMIFIVSLFNADLMNLFVTNTMVNMDMVKVIICLSIFIYLMSFIIMYFINLKIFKNGVNVD